MSSELLLAAEMAERNAKRQTAWEHRWLRRFGHLPSRAPIVFDFHTDQLREEASLSTSVFVPDVCERHGNATILHIPRHKKQYETRRYPPKRWSMGR